MWDFDLTVSICSWNTREDLRACLQSLREVAPANVETLVVENNSADGSDLMVEQEFPEVRLLRQPRNLGFCGGHNLAMRERRGRHILLLNSDTVVHRGALDVLLKALDEHPEAGVLGPKLLNGDSSLQYSCRRFPNPVAAAFRNTLLGRLFPKNAATRDYLMQEWDHASRREVDWVSGAAMLIRDAAYDSVGELDERFFMFCEDVDYCWRVGRSGMKVLYIPESQITHLIGRSTDQAPNRMIGRFHRSMLLFYRKNQLPLAWRPIRPFLYAAAATALALRGGAFILKNKIDVARRRLSR